jgi:AraC family transcriptional regulator
VEIQTDPLPDVRVREILALMESNLQKPLTLKQLAISVQLSPAHISRLFRRHLGASPYAILKQMRLERAASLLACSGLALKEIPCEVGYLDMSHFARAFKALYGYTPQEWRIRAREARIEPWGDWLTEKNEGSAEPVCR